MTWNKIDGGRWEDFSRGLVPGKRKCGDQKISGGRKECESDGTQRMSGVDGKERRAGCRSPDRYDGPRPFNAWANSRLEQFSVENTQTE